MRFIMTHSLKTILSAVGVAALIASPALAKPRTHVQAQQPAVVSSDAVVAPNGRVIGADPDANIRAEMLRDFQTSEGAN
jgi:hypothetical protein